MECKSSENRATPFEEATLVPLTERLRGPSEILQFSESVFEHLTISTVGDLARIARKYPSALSLFPEGCKLEISADGERGNYLESGYLVVYVQLLFPTKNGGLKGSGRERLATSSCEAITEFEGLLKKLSNGGE